ncbi:MAG: cobalamin B12-binding domain-containing protein [Moorellales bacterium]
MQEKMEANTKSLAEAIAELREEEALKLAQSLLSAGAKPMDLLEACRQGVEVVGQRFEKGEYFLPELMLAGEMLTQISGLVKEKMSQSPEEVAASRLGKVVLGTVKGDIHDIGKNIVAFLLDVNGFEVIDIGVDAPAEKFVEAVKEHQPQVVGMSCLLTLAYEPMKETVEALAAAGLRDKVKIMIGGAATNDQVRVYTGADAWGKDAVEAVNLARKWVGR